AAPVLNDNFLVNAPTGNVKAKTVKIPVGQTKTIEVDLFSDAPTSGPWSIKAYEVTGVFGGSASLSLNLDTNTGQNGDKVHLTINVLKTTQFGFELFALESDLSGQRNLWIGAVGN